MERQFKGIWIPAEIWETRDLSWNEKVVLLEIDSFTASGRDCFISDEYIGGLIGVNERTARRILSKLIDLGYVKKTRFDGRKRYIESTLTAHIVRAEWTNLAGQGGQKCPGTNINITNNQLQNIKEENKESVKEKKEEKRFQKPTLSEVQAYCLERGNGIDAQNFLDFYEAKGWKIGTSPMKDWKAAIRTWESKRKTLPPTPNSARPLPPSQESLTEYYQKLMKTLHKGNDPFFDDTDNQ